LALPLRRCPGFSGLGLEVFRSTASSEQSEDRSPAPSLSSGATPEFDHSRQSLDSRARSPIGRPFRVRTVERLRAPARNEVARRRRTDEGPVPTRRPEPLAAAPIRSRRGRPPKKLHQPRIDGRRSRHQPEGSYRTAPSEDPRPKPREVAAEPPRVGVASHRRPTREPAAKKLVRDNTQDHDWPSCTTSESSDPTFRRKLGRRIATSPSDLTPMRESDTPSLYPFAHHRPLPIVDPQQAARSAVTIRVIASDPASTRRLRFRESSRRFHPTTRRTRLGAQQKVRCFERSRHGHIVWSV
jgi:hypothetical protein